MPMMTEKPRQIAIAGEYDVLIAGGGTAGAVAAIAAARKGARTLVVEQFGFLGGTQTGALVGPLCPNYDIEGNPLTKGIGQEIWDRLSAMGAAEKPAGGKYAKDAWPWFDPEMLKYLLDDMIREAGAQALFHAFISDSIVEDNNIRGIIIESKSGRQAILAQVTVDATGDADVAFRAGVPCESGRREDGMNQAVSLRFHLGNVDLEKAAEFLRANGMPGIEDPFVSYAAGSGCKDIAHIIEAGVDAGVIDEETTRYFQFYSMPGRPGEISFNCPEIRNANPTDTFDLSRIQMEGRGKIRKLIHFCRTCLPGFKHCYLVATAPLIGVRTSRRIVGEYVLTEEDVLTGRKFADAVARNNWPTDIHAPKQGEELIFKPHLQPGDYCEIPYRCLVPKEIGRLLAAGRCISTTFEALAGVRISRVCQALGQAAGAAAVMAVKLGVAPREIDGRALNRQLVEDGMM
ncbi:MAG: FAD-dependent oxidoreductase [bacterium]